LLIGLHDLEAAQLFRALLIFVQLHPNPSKPRLLSWPSLAVLCSKAVDPGG
jgi:hypothetical protein